MIVLGIESSCDELACALLDGDGRTVRANVVHSQAAMHAAFGGIVPEVASRDHVRQLSSTLSFACSEGNVSIAEVDGIAVTSGPGLVGSLLCGVEFAKGIALAAKKPLIGINHLEGHVAAAYLEPEAPSRPFVCLLISGGHTLLFIVRKLCGTYELLGTTRDDAAGEAFDKTAKVLGLGYPGGIAIDRLAEHGDPTRYAFPKMMQGRDNFEFSFSGLKTAAVTRIRSLGGPPAGADLADFCASFQHAVVENLVDKAFRATRAVGLDQLVLAGGVAANRRLRARATERGASEGIRVFLPSRAFCTDNAAMIARAGLERLANGERHGLDLQARAHWPLA